MGQDYLRDSALEGQAGDEFAHRHYVDVLEDILLKSETPLNVGLFGKWGVGKSSIAHMLRDRIRGGENLKGFGYAEVDAWGLSPESLPQGLLEELNSQTGSPYKQEEMEDVLYNQRHIQHAGLRRPKGRRWILLGGIGAAAAFAAALFLYPDAAGLTAIGVLVTTLLVLSAKMIFSKAGKTIPPTASPRQFGRIYDGIVGKHRPKKLVVVIDNLDRCESAVAVKLLGLIQTFMVKDNCVNVLACDDEALVAHLKRSGTVRTDGDGNEFLGKFFQVALRVPPFMGESLRSYAKKQIGMRSVDFGQFALNILLSGAIDNPRKIKEFLNAAVALYRLAELRERDGMIQSGLITGDTNSLLKSVVLRHEWPRFCEALEEDPGMYQDGAKQREWCERASEMPEAERSRLLRFLDSTQMPGADIVPFLRMSQPPYAALPGISEFEDAFSRSDPKAVRMFEELDAGAQEAYMGRIDEILRESASESDPGMPALSSNVAMLAELAKAAPDSPVRARMAATLGHYVAGPLLGNARGMVERIGAEQVGLMPARMRDIVCERLVSDAFRADPPDLAALELLSKNRAVVGAGLAERMDKMAVEKIDAAGLWDEFFVTECLEYRREGAPMSGLVSKIISEATFGVAPSAGYNILCAQLAGSMSPDEAETLRSRIADLVTQCADSDTPLPELLLEQIGRIELDGKIDGALRRVLQSGSDQRRNAEILRVMAEKRGEDTEYLEAAGYAFDTFVRTDNVYELKQLFDKPQYLEFLTTKAAIDAMLELRGDVGYIHSHVLRFLLTHTPENLKEHVGAAFHDAIVSKGAFRYGLRLDGANSRSREFDPDLIDAISSAYVTKARNLRRTDQYGAYMQAAEMGNRKHADEIASYAESLTESADESKRDDGFRLLEALKKNRAERSEAGQ